MLEEFKACDKKSLDSLEMAVGRNINIWGTSVAQSVKCPTFDFG